MTVGQFMRAGAIHPRKADAFLRMLLIRLRSRYGTFPITRGRLLGRTQRLLPLQCGEAPRSGDEGDIICAAQFTFRRNNSCAQAISIPKADYSLPPSHCVRHLPRQREVVAGVTLEPRLSWDTDPCAAGYRCSKFMRAGAIHPESRLLSPSVSLRSTPPSSEGGRRWLDS
jgi:hypothetical protein